MQMNRCRFKRSHLIWKNRKLVQVQCELEKENRVKRCIRDNSREVLYQYIDLPECRSSLHLMCRVCGRMFHLEPEQTNKLVEHVEKAQGFVIDKSETILYGVCKDCR